MISKVFNLKDNLFKLERNEKVGRTAAKMKLEATVISDILYVFDQGNLHKMCLWQPWTVINFSKDPAR